MTQSLLPNVQDLEIFRRGWTIWGCRCGVANYWISPSHLPDWWEPPHFSIHQWPKWSEDQTLIKRIIGLTEFRVTLYHGKNVSTYFTCNINDLIHLHGGVDLYIHQLMRESYHMMCLLCSHGNHTHSGSCLPCCDVLASVHTTATHGATHINGKKVSLIGGFHKLNRENDKN